MKRERDAKCRQGTTLELQHFFAHTAELCPQMRHDYQLLDWTAHKSYLLQLEQAGVSIVPTCLIPASSADKRGEYACLSPSPPEAPESSPGSLKRAMQARGWAQAVLKPAVGTRCEGVMRLGLQTWSLAMAFGAASLLRDGDCVLQPFLPPVAALAPPAAPEAPVESLQADLPATCQRDTLLGEVCVLCIDGEIAHAVHKNPRLWGWHESCCGCAGSVLDLESAVCTCSSPPVRRSERRAVCPLALRPPACPCVSPEDAAEESLPAEVRALLQRAPVDSVQLPLPAALGASVRKVLAVIRDRR